MLFLQHAKSEGLGTIQDALIAAGVEFECVRSFEVQSIPRDIDESSGLIVMGGPMGAYETDRFPSSGCSGFACLKLMDLLAFAFPFVDTEI
jgi:GMP synthase (glutamine-hydrolysing)